MLNKCVVGNPKVSGTFPYPSDSLETGNPFFTCDKKNVEPTSHSSDRIGRGSPANKPRLRFPPSYAMVFQNGIEELCSFKPTNKKKSAVQIDRKAIVFLSKRINSKVSSIPWMWLSNAIAGCVGCDGVVVPNFGVGIFLFIAYCFLMNK